MNPEIFSEIDNTQNRAPPPTPTPIYDFNQDVLPFLLVHPLQLDRGDYGITILLLIRLWYV